MEGEIDSQGRVLIPPQLREPAAMQGDVVVLGLPKYLEVWNRARVRIAEATRSGSRTTIYKALSDHGI